MVSKFKIIQLILVDNIQKFLLHWIKSKKNYIFHTSLYISHVLVGPSLKKYISSIK